MLFWGFASGLVTYRTRLLLFSQRATFLAMGRTYEVHILSSLLAKRTDFGLRFLITSLGMKHNYSMEAQSWVNEARLEPASLQIK